MASSPDQAPQPVDTCHYLLKYTCGAVEDVFTDCRCKEIIKVQRQPNGCGVCSVCHPDSD